MDILYKKMLAQNKAWAAKTREKEPEFFERLEKTQSPSTLWIGCSDSRVPANQITGSQPGEIFVHRNIANLVVPTDMNILSVLDYAVNALKVKHIIVCGHYGCGGVMAAMNDKSIGLIDNWLANIKTTYLKHSKELDDIKDEKEKFNRMVELNALHQMHNLAHTAIVQNAWAKGQPLSLHGWIYSLKSGEIKDLESSIDSNKSIENIFKLNF